MRIRIIATLTLAGWALVSSAQILNYSLLRAEGPSPRFDGTIAYDPAGRRIFLFGGQDTSPRHDLWA